MQLKIVVSTDSEQRAPQGVKWVYVCYFDVVSQLVGSWALGDACRTLTLEWTGARVWVSDMREIATGDLHVPVNSGL
ncbi:uncharacterized protein TrAFT101_000730 [Trichoderma asperellum]|uniref:uncharacterized protein n=1 Tax=Trichoderma asperellum TaxID=101201 RepID=UPI003323BBD7|nr:hypothetical protein TrAFT101_000730 [Trichoderma asperellum]